MRMLCYTFIRSRVIGACGTNESQHALRIYTQLRSAAAASNQQRGVIPDVFSATVAACRRAGEYTAALAVADTAAAQYSNGTAVNWECYREIIQCYSAIGDAPRAVATLEKAVAAGITKWELVEATLYACLQCSDQALAMHVFSEWKSLNNGDMTVYTDLIEACVSAGEYDDTLAVVSCAEGTEPITQKMLYTGTCVDSVHTMS
jgi:tetratricopeptide (TPR) repeat protein